MPFPPDDKKRQSVRCASPQIADGCFLLIAVIITDMQCFRNALPWFFTPGFFIVGTSPCIFHAQNSIFPRLSIVAKNKICYIFTVKRQ
jgi:hypothetical protein